METSMRLDRLLSSLALASRNEAKTMVRKGRLSINGHCVQDAGQRIAPNDLLQLDGETVDKTLTHHLLMHKPAGVLTAASDTRQATVMDLLPPKYRSLQCMPVGRLDKDTEGLLLFTTDGTLHHRLLAPKNEVQKVYEATVTGRLSEATIQRFQRGIQFKEFVSLPAVLDILDAGEEYSLARVTVHEGKYHQIKRMFSACGHEVTALKRLAFGPLLLDPALSPGQYRDLTAHELSQLKEAAGLA